MSRERHLVEFDDIKLADELCLDAPWTWERWACLKALVVRNALVGSSLGRERYIAMRDLLWAVTHLLNELWEARQELASYRNQTADPSARP